MQIPTDTTITCTLDDGRQLPDLTESEMFVSGDYYSSGALHMQQSGRPFYGKTNITGSSTFFFFDTFQTVTVMLTRNSGKN